MKCPNCGKNIDDVDCSCGWCTFCGTLFDVKSYSQPETEEE